MILTLQRFYMGHDCTLGIMTVGGIPEFFTIELPWENNAPNLSCIPPASYPVKWVLTETAGNRNGRGLGIENVPERTLIRIHAGNTVNDFKGCIGVGLQRWNFKESKGVTQSRTALNSLFDRMADEKEAIMKIYNPAHLG